MRRTFSQAGIFLVSFLLAFSPLAGSASSISYLNESQMFTERDWLQVVDLSGAETITVADGTDVRITSSGTYVLTGSAREMTVCVEAGKEDKIQLVFDSLTIANTDAACIYVQSADKVFINLAGDSALSVTGEFRKAGKADAVIYSEQDLVLNGIASLAVASSKSGIFCKDDLKITGGSYTIQAAETCIEANDSIRISGGDFMLTAGTDGLHADHGTDDTLGFIYISGGTIIIEAEDDGIHALSVLQNDGGTIHIRAWEGIEATVILITGGALEISASDDGINAGRKSSAYTPSVTFTGGSVTIIMGQGDTDGVDSNGDIIMSGGTVKVIGSHPFDYDGTARLSGGTLIVNGEQMSEIPDQLTNTPDGWGGWRQQP